MEYHLFGGPSRFRLTLSQVNSNQSRLLRAVLQPIIEIGL